MLELVAVYFLCRKCSRTARAKGYKGGWFGFLAAALWFGLEILVAVIAVLASDRDIGYGGVYVFGLFGAGLGALIAWLIVKGLKDRTAYMLRPDVGAAEYPSRDVTPISQPMPPQAPLFCRKCGYRLPQGSRFCEKCGLPI